MITRRQLIQTGLYGIAALQFPAKADTFFINAGFTHGVASGEPQADSVLLWTRYVANSDVKLEVEVASDERFRRLVGGGTAVASPDRDYTAKVVVDGLAPDRWYYYRFVAPGGVRSRIGRTRTLPLGEVQRFGIGLFSCANLPFGHFNAYAHASERSDLDLIVHVGDYLYEYGIGTYPAVNEALAGRRIVPEHEIVTLADYRLRYAAYRLDPDLQRLHERFPMIAQWDDHELANDAWVDGAQNHQSDTEGSWAQRKAIAQQVYREWMPVSDDYWREYSIGNLASLYKAETRLAGRSAPLDLEAALRGQADLPRALREFKDGPLQDPSRSLFGATQEQWLFSALASSRRRGVRWQVLAQQLVMGEVVLPPEVRNWIPPDAPQFLRDRAKLGIAAASAGLPYNFDGWGGFPAARNRLLTAALEADANLIVLGGDSHNAWAQDLCVNSTPAAVEFATHSVTSPGFESLAPQVDPSEVAAALRRANGGIVFTDSSRRGYTSIELTQQGALGAFHFLASIRERDTRLAETRRLAVEPGRRKLELR